MYQITINFVINGEFITKGRTAKTTKEIAMHILELDYQPYSIKIEWIWQQTA